MGLVGRPNNKGLRTDALSFSLKVDALTIEVAHKIAQSQAIGALRPEPNTEFNHFSSFKNIRKIKGPNIAALEQGTPPGFGSLLDIERWRGVRADSRNHPIHKN